MIDLIDESVKTVVGKSLAGLQLGDNIKNFLPYVDTIIDGSETPWTANIPNNPGVTLYQYKDCKFKNNGGYALYINNPRIELSFNSSGSLKHIDVGKGYSGEIFEGLKIGDRLADIKHPTYHCDPDEVHYLADEDGEIIDGIWFFTASGELDEDPDQIIESVKVYDYSIE